MAKKENKWYGKSEEELKTMDDGEFMLKVSARIRRSLKRETDPRKKKLIKELNAGKNNIKTHCRDLIITPKLLGKTLRVYNGKEFTQVLISMNMLGHYLGEFAPTRRNVSHSAPGIGATRSSASVSVK